MANDKDKRLAARLGRPFDDAVKYSPNSTSKSTSRLPHKRHKNLP